MGYMAISHAATKALHERIRSLIHQGRQIVLIDFSNCSPVEVEKLAGAVPDSVTAQPLGSVLLLVDFNGASFDQDALKAMKECAVFDKLYIKKSTWVGAGNVPRGFGEDLKAFSRRGFPSFKILEDKCGPMAQEPTIHPCAIEAASREMSAEI